MNGESIKNSNSNGSDHDADAEWFVCNRIRQLMRERSRTGYYGKSIVEIAWEKGDVASVRVTDETSHRIKDIQAERVAEKVKTDGET